MFRLIKVFVFASLISIPVSGFSSASNKVTAGDVKGNHIFSGPLLPPQSWMDDVSNPPRKCRVLYLYDLNVDSEVLDLMDHIRGDEKIYCNSNNLLYSEEDCSFLVKPCLAWVKNGCGRGEAGCPEEPEYTFSEVPSEFVLDTPDDVFSDIPDDWF